ncbi:estradiol 17-beta-dehydrogenase 2-like [Protopterus annectens]|uniref:estradiol 17-beta-dehydrogenase 2-like n=1 Tax=Protopterus annectens TaxID=7888 RepID=UPI001CFB5B98|nr:estradiol 17-beta-dehydrogenase 2-like [Protopterus annectens]
MMMIPGYAGLVFFCIICLILYKCHPHCRLLPVDGKTVVITGCDSGFGHELVKHLDARGFTVFAGFLNEDGPGAKALKEHCSSNLSTLQLDVTKPEEIRKAYFYVKSKVNARGLWGLVSNAGTVHFVCDGELIPMSDYRKTLDVNFLGAVEVFKVFCPLLRKARGRFVTVTSLAGYIPLAGTVAYNASKAAMVKFAETVKEELSIWGVKVAVVAPGGPFKTSIFHSNEELNYQAENIIKNLQPDVIEDYSTEYINYWKDAIPALKANACESFTVVINDIYHALMAEKPNYEYFPGKGAFHGKFIYHYCPGWVFNLLNPFKPKNLPLPAAIKKNLTDSRQCNS